MNMFGPFLLMWVVTVLPVALVPQWIHPRFCDPDAAERHAERKEYRRWAYLVVVGTWLAMGVFTLWVSQSWNFWIWFGTEVFFGSLIWRSVRLRVQLARERRRVDREFHGMVGGL